MKPFYLVLFITFFALSNSNAQESKVEFKQSLHKKTSDLHEPLDRLLKKYVSEDGMVDYSGFTKSHVDLLRYIEALSLIYPDLNRLNEDELLAYWINAYNALTINLVLKNYPIKSIKDIKDPWKQKLWKFGNTSLSLNDIEHKILRNMQEPRIHFAIVCASFSCPKLENEAFKGDIIDSQLNRVTRTFLEDPTKNTFEPETASISKIFKWFSKDFKASGGVLEFIKEYKDIPDYKKSQLSYKDYNWALNE